MLKEVTDLIVNCINSGGKVLTFGVGGNAANAIHLAAELSGKFEQYERPLPCIDLVSNPSVISAIATDFGWEYVFERQIKALARFGDVVIAFSISTKGSYLINAVGEAKRQNCQTVLICGKNTTLEPTLHELLVWELDSLDTPRVQEEQLKIVHELCQVVKSYFG